jgi:hypothetical protein
VLGDQLFHVFRPRDLQAVDYRALHPRVVVDKGDRVIFVTMVQGRQQLPPGFPGTVDNHVFRQRTQLGLVVGPHDKTTAPDAQ